MNPYSLENPARLKLLLKALQDALETNDHNAIIEKAIADHGDEDGMLHRQYRKPRYWIHNLLIIAQITDDEDDPMEEETYHIKEGGPVAIQNDGDKNIATPFRDLPPVMFL
jgi:hypothetical protein